jgi:hypothetical protein
MATTASVRIRLQNPTEFRIQLTQAADPFGTEAVVTVDVAPGVTIVVTNADAAVALAGALADASQVLLDQASAPQAWAVPA